MTKILYAIRSKAHFSYHESTINELLKSGVTLVLAFDEYWSYYGNPSHAAFEAWRAEHPTVEVTYYPTRHDILRKPLMFLRELRSYNNYCRRGDDYEFYRNRWASYLKLPKRIHRIVTSKRLRPVMGCSAIRKMLTLVERVAPADAMIMQWLKAQNIALLIASPCNMRYSQEIELVKAAHKLNIVTVIPVLSWDNTSTKGLFHILPDRILAWHQSHLEDCVKYHGVDESKIKITGAPFFDKWYEAPSNPVSYETFCKRVGLDASKPYVLYLGSSANIAKDETWFVRDLRMAMKNHADPKIRDMQILYRSHPANWEHGLALEKEQIAVWPKQGTLPDTRASFEDFRDSLDHATCVVGINTSGMLDAIIKDRAVISPLIEQYRFTQEKAEHFQRMRDHQALLIAHNATEVADIILQVMQGFDASKLMREKFVLKYIRPHGLDVSAGEKITEIVLQLLAKHISRQPGSAATVSHVTTHYVPKKVMKTDIKQIFDHFFEKIEQERQSAHYQFYLSVRDKIMAMMGSYTPSTYWYQEIIGFAYLFDASPLIVSQIRQHCYHITGERDYIYRAHHAHKAPPYIKRLGELAALDKSHLFVPESEACGGFGHMSHLGMLNLDTLKFYEVLIGLDKAKCLEPFKQANGRKAILEIGSGWGGFAYQFKTLFANTTVFCIDLPATLLFSSTYLAGAMPDAKIAIWGDMPADELLARWQEFDFIMLPADKLAEFKPLQLDLTVNMCSFQEMTTEQVRGYIHHVADLNCTMLYSLNRDRSHHNPELSLVSELLKERYHTELIPVLPTEYCSVGTKSKSMIANPLSNPATYRHIAGTLK